MVQGDPKQSTDSTESIFILLPTICGLMGTNGDYWGPVGTKFHGEYVGKTIDIIPCVSKRSHDLPLTTPYYNLHLCSNIHEALRIK